MKRFFALIPFSVTSLVVVQHASAQDSSGRLVSSWHKLTTDLQHRVDLAIVLAANIEKSKKPEKDITGPLRTDAIGLSLFIDSSKNLDSITVEAVYHKNNRLAQSISKALVWVMENKKLKSNPELMGLQAQIEGNENRIAVAKRNYNEICVELNRSDLLFDDKPGQIPK